LLRFAAWTVSFFLLAADKADAAEVPPYEARIVTPGAPVHSGPRQNFYPTDTLAQGDVVEVHREQPGGWLGIRPPDDSFSWLFGRHVKPLDGGLGEIDKDDVPSRIGSRLGEQRNAVQVRLKKGEIVEIISNEILAGEAWYKIAPPSGEFRWIHMRHIAREAAPPAGTAPPIGLAAPAEAIEPSAPPVVTVPFDSTAPAVDRNVTLAADTQPVDEPSSDQTWQPSPLASAVAATPPTTAPTKREPQTETVPTENPPPTTAAAATQPSAATVDDGLARQLTDIEMRLSRFVAEPPATWQIAPLRLEAGQLLVSAKTDDERAVINTTIAKLDRFAAIAARYQQVAAGAGSGDPRTTTPLALSQNPPSSQPLTPDTSRFDAVGILRPVVSKRPGAPQFALVDERGTVAAFVTPTPDVNLQPYLGHRIGITGSRGFIPEFQRAHVTAGRVAPLSERMLR